EVPRAVLRPEGEVDVAAVARRLRPGLRRERGDIPELGGDAAERLAHEDLLVGGPQRRRVAGGDLLLAMAELRVVLLEDDVLTLKCVGERIDVLLRGRHPDRREAQALVHRAVAVLGRHGERELVLERGLQHGAALPERRYLPLEEGALADRSRRAVEADVVADHAAARRRVGKNAEGLGIRNEPDL